tara:strand:- start:745 stop:2040 length:1296 start_codon:yes stop_codon:yes gene_type:complete
MKKKKLIFIQLNEINFEYVLPYLGKIKIDNFKKLIDEGIITTSSEKNYEELEPWIQWASIATGKTLQEHKIFRLGDIIKYKESQIYEILENKNLSVGAICPMNVENRMKDPIYFIPDPWTNTSSDNSFWSKNITKTLVQVVNDNSKGKASLHSLMILFLAMIRFGKFSNYLKFFYFFITSFSKKWRRALFLDLLIHDIHLSLLNKNNVNFSTIFFNGLAHIQHHYFLNSIAVKNKVKNPNWYIKENLDPFAEALVVYNKIIGDYLEKNNYDLILATGLRQVAYDRVKYYYRLKDHKEFLNKLNITYKSVEPRMTGDFLITFESLESTQLAQNILSNLLTKDSEQIFSLIDNRGLSLFITLTYDKEIKKEFVLRNTKSLIDLYDYVDFVGIKNGKHDEKGYLYYRGNIKKFLPDDNKHVKEIFNSINSYFSS